MALLDFLKNKKEADKAKELKAEKVSEKKSDDVKAEKKSEKKAVKSIRKSGSFSYTLIKEPHISEKGTLLSGNNKYIFKVQDNSNKSEIKKAIEGVYGVNVLCVNTIRIPHKKRRVGRTQGFKKAYSKAIVTIKQGQKIEIL